MPMQEFGGAMKSLAFSGGGGVVTSPPVELHGEDGREWGA